MEAPRRVREGKNYMHKQAMFSTKTIQKINSAPVSRAECGLASIDDRE